MATEFGRRLWAALVQVHTINAQRREGVRVEGDPNLLYPALPLTESLRRAGTATFAKHGREHYVRMGKKGKKIGAEVRWARVRAARQRDARSAEGD